jgi:hypothetical protein
VDAVENGFIIHVEHDMRACELLSPAENRVNNSEHLLHLDVMVTIATRTSCGEPGGTEMPPQAFGTTGIRVDVELGARW